MNESLKRIKAWAHWKTIEFNNLGRQISEDPRQGERVFIEDIRELVQAVIDADEAMKEPSCGKQSAWRDRYAGEMSEATVSKANKEKK